MHQVDYRQKYKNLKQKLKFLVYEQECFLEELRKSQKKLLRVTRDKSFLFDRLLLHTKVDESSGDSDATASSDSEPDTTTSKRKKVGLMLGGHLSGLQLQNPGLNQAILMLLSSDEVCHDLGGNRKRVKPAPKRSKTVKASSSKQVTSKSRQHLPGQMTRAELEQHLDTKTDYNGIEVPPNKLPSDIFSDNSNHLSDDADEDLVIDVP